MVAIVALLTRLVALEKEVRNLKAQFAQNSSNFWTATSSDLKIFILAQV